MRLTEKIRDFLWQRGLSKDTTGRVRNRATGTLQTAESVFVIYDASEEHQNKEAEAFFSLLKSLDVKVKSLGFARYKIVPHYCIPQLSKQFICKKDLDLSGIPRKSFMTDFFDEEFDLLISLDMEQSKALQYVAAMSMARFKVGWYDTSNMPYFDLLLRTREGDMKGYMNQIIHYLSTINTQ